MNYLVLSFLLVFSLSINKDVQCYTSNPIGRFDPWHENEVEVEGRKCPVAFTEIGGRCYFYGYFKLNWFRAMEFCHSFGSTVSLACIETTEENDHLKKWLLEHGDHTTGVWVGGSDNGHIGRWAWFPTGQLIKNFNWGPSQPSGGDQHCMYIVGGYLGYQWADFHCGFEMTFLCEYDVNPVQAWRRRREMLPNRLGSNSQEEDSGSLEDQSEFENSTSRSPESHLEYFPDSAEIAILKQKKTGYLWSGYADKLKKAEKATPGPIIHPTESHQTDMNVLITANDKFTNQPDTDQLTTSTQAATTTTESPFSYSKDQLTDSWSLLNFLKTVVKSGG